MEFFLFAEQAAGKLSGYPEKSPFCSTYIAHTLSLIDEPRAHRMLEKTLHFLEQQKQRGGLWRYWNNDAPLYWKIPPDVDDTACVSHLLQRAGRAVPDNKEFLFFNRDSRGLFYTWIIPRIGFWRRPRLLLTLLRDQNSGRAYSYWKEGASRDDVDSVVNANVLAYVGSRTETQSVIDYLLNLAQSRNEAASDKYYRSEVAFYYALGRCYSLGITRLSEAVELMIARFETIVRPDGSIGRDVLETSLAASALMAFGVSSPHLAPAIEFIASSQADDGGWPTCAFYYDGRPQPQVWWGSRAVTTGFCLEAILRFSQSRASVV